MERPLSISQRSRPSVEQASTLRFGREFKINFQRLEHITGRVVGEEVQHAIDFAYGAKHAQEIAAVARQHLPSGADATIDEIGEWWHRRVFTRLLQSVHQDRHGLGALEPFSDDIYRAYVEIAKGTLTKDEILSSSFTSLF